MVLPTDREMPDKLEDSQPKRQKIEKPRKCDYRQRAHCNPLADSFIIYPRTPDHVDWSVHFPHFVAPLSGVDPLDVPLQNNTATHPLSYTDEPVSDQVNGKSSRSVDFLDVGCGFGGLLISLAPKFKDKLIMGMEIREQVTNYVGQRIYALRNESPGEWGNVSVLRSNTMKYLVNYMRKGQLEKMFFCFPDPHFKRKNWRRRIINDGLLAQYAYVMKVGGLLYTVTDVKELFDWEYDCLKRHPLFEEISAEEKAKDEIIKAIENDTEEGMKVKRNGKPCWSAVFRRIEANAE
eukprot:gene1183-970_t